jgi:hypothetical protein
VIVDQLGPEGTATATAGDAPARPDSRRTTAAPSAVILLAVDVIIGGAVLGFWFIPFLVGVAMGLTLRWRRRWIAATATIVAVVGWGIPLAWPALSGMPVTATARTVAALAGLPASAGLMLALTLLLGVIQVLTGAWLARAVIGPRRR